MIKVDISPAREPHFTVYEGESEFDARRLTMHAIVCRVCRQTDDVDTTRVIITKGERVVFHGPIRDIILEGLTGVMK